MKILLCEDENSIARALSTMLVANNYDVQIASDGQMALEFINKGSYDVIIMDYMMPKVDGVTVIKRTRATQNNVPIIMLTAKSEISDKVEGLDSGANDYLTKPFAFKELLARIKVLTRNRHDYILQHGDITLDKGNSELKTPIGSLRLANKEQDMLEMLINSPNGKIPKERFLDKVWRDESIKDASVVNIYISYLRKKLNLLSSKFTIKNDDECYYLEKV